MPDASAARSQDMRTSLWLEKTAAGTLAEGFYARGTNLLVLVGLHSGHADAADAGALGHDRQPALHRRDARHLQELGALLHALLPVVGRAPRARRGAALLHGDVRVGRGGAVHAHEVQQVAAVVEDRDADVPVV